MIRSLAIAAILAALASPLQASALGQPAKADPAQQALVQMLQEAQAREAQALVQVYGLRAQVAELQRQLAEQAKRGDEAKPEEPPAKAD